MTEAVEEVVCQRPKRAFFISTTVRNSEAHCGLCVNALNGLSSFLLQEATGRNLHTLVRCQRPKRAFFISTKS